MSFIGFAWHNILVSAIRLSFLHGLPLLANTHHEVYHARQKYGSL